MSTRKNRTSNKSGWGGKRPGAGRPRKIAVQNAAFEGARFHQPARGFIYMPLAPEREYLPGSRLELIRRCRWLYNNIGFAGRAIDGPVRYAIAGGIIPQARTRDAKWNQQVEEHFHDTVGTTPFAFDAAAQFDFYSAQAMLARQAALDGDVFVQLVKSSNGAAMCRFLSAEKVGTGPDRDTAWRDGVLVDQRTQRPLKYRVLTGGDDWVDVPADDMISIAMTRRLGFVRGVSDLARAVGHLHDTSEILSFTKQSFKLASQIAFILRANSDVRVGAHIPDPDVANKTVADRPLKIDDIMQGAIIPNLRPGEDIDTIKNEHPGESFQPFLDYLARDISWGVGLSPEILWSMTGTSGAGYRLALADAQTFFEERQRVVTNTFCRRYWKYWVWSEIEAGRLPHPGDDWFRVEWTTPRKATVDFGRDTKQLAELVSRGFMSLRQFADMHGWDIDAVDQSIVDEYVRRKQLAESVGGTIAEVFGDPAKPVVAALPQGDGDDEEEK